MSVEIFRRALAVLEGGQPAVLVTVVAAEHAPREAGARMLVFPDGRTEGTVGGGALEQHAVQKAQELLQKGPSTLLEPHDLGDLGMLCGGRAVLFYEVLQAPPVLAICGAGHVGVLLARLAREATPWPIVLYDDRTERGEFVPLHVGFHPLPSYHEVPALTGHIYAVVATESHAKDVQAVAAFLRQDPGPAYLGVLGSRTKANALREKLLALGFPQKKVELMRCPAGLPLGGKDPGSIAVSILAEILAYHHRSLPEAWAHFSRG